MEPYENVLSVRNNSENFLRNNKTVYDFIYVDGDHTEKAVYADAINCWPLLKSGGILAFDDYLWGQGLEPHTTPKPAIDRFLAEKQGEYEILNEDYQVWLLKK
jgi:predicted O-methyltransferase YrrM